MVSESSHFKRNIGFISGILCLFAVWDFLCKFHKYDMHFEGIIIGKFIDKANHGADIITCKNTDDYMIDNPHLFDAIDIGDYIIKRHNSTDYLLIKKGNPDTLVFKQY